MGVSYGTAAPPARRRYGRWFAYLALGFFGAALAYDALLFLLSLFAVSTIAGIAASALLAAALAAGGLWIFDEMRPFYRLKTADQIRDAAARLRGSASHAEGLALVNQILPGLHGNLAAHDRSLDHVIELVVDEEVLVERITGRGTFVASPRLTVSLPTLLSFTEEMKRRGIVPGTVVLSPAAVARIMRSAMRETRCSGLEKTRR